MSFLRTEYDNLLGSRSTPLIRLIVVNIIIFLIANIWVNIPGCEPYFYDWFSLPSSPVKLLHRPWTLFTYMFVHVSIGHILSNMLWLYFIGRIFVDFIRGRRLFYTYVLGGFAGGILFFIYANIFHDPGYLYGASAGVMAVIVAIAILVPDYQVYVFIIGEVRLKYVVLVAFLLTSIVDIGLNSGGKVSHIGGALYGVIYMLQYKKGTDYSEMTAEFFTKIKKLFTPGKGGVKIKKSGGSGVKQNKKATSDNQKKIDVILDKISSSGYDALTKEEKDFLFKSSKGGDA
jgi:membrane associated rhomboid family serine protease